MIKFKNLKHFILPVGLILVLSFSRLIPHPSNFTPILAVGVFAGFYFRNFILSSFIVISAMFIGDLVIGFHSTMIFYLFFINISSCNWTFNQKIQF